MTPHPPPAVTGLARSVKRTSAPTDSNLSWMIVYASAITLYAAANILINYLGKGSTWDNYPAAEALWVVLSIAAAATCTYGRRAAILIIALLFLDSWVDVCAMGGTSWWAGPPGRRLLIPWKWDQLRAAHRLNSLIWAYWICTWGLAAPARCLAMARMMSGNWGRRFWIIALGLNLSWFTAPQDVLYYFVWVGLWDRRWPYFDYLPPAGFWNLWKMLLLRVPIGVGVGALLVRAGLRGRGGRRGRDWLTIILIAIALLAIAAYALICLKAFMDAS
jgi:hypothetical protein